MHNCQRQDGSGKYCHSGMLHGPAKKKIKVDKVSTLCYVLCLHSTCKMGITTAIDDQYQKLLAFL